MLDDRKLAVLRAIVTDYVCSREPVGSRAIVEKHHLDVSPATVRNDMALLEDEGYITHPHTSAGRVPTDKGYRMFVDRLSTIKPLSSAEKRAISAFLTGAVDLDDVISRTVRLLAQVTSQVAIMRYPSTRQATIKRVDLIRLHDDRGLLVLINSLGKVSQRHIDLAGVDDDGLLMLRDRFNETLNGASPAQATDRLERLPNEVSPLFRGQATSIAALLMAMVAFAGSDKVAVAGLNNLVQFAQGYDAAIKPVLDTIEEQVVLLRLLGEVTPDVSVRIGQENQHSNLNQASVVATAYAVDDHWSGLGVVGPTRMDYPSTIASVQAVARYVSHILAEG
ncbi:MAG: heat-inducible transcriptional repressor HrcA [Propionibacteriaceae bacterium]|jgi:heat-inducible transcriptional repressor|nr:heat-inducible transcriptional repressor HrcA [Propionibacteriaceae bacterium]